MNILIIEKRASCKDIFQSSLLLKKHTCTYVDNDADAFDVLRTSHRQSIDFIIINQFAQEENNLPLIGAFRKESTVPIFVIAHHEDHAYNALVLDAGADECMSYPFSLDEFSARLQRLTHRRHHTLFVNTVITFGDLTIDLKRHAVYTSKKFIDLTRTEYKILLYLVMHRGSVVSRDDLSEAMHIAEGNIKCDKVVTTHMFNMRQKIGRHIAIQTIPCRGYIMI